MQSPTARDGSMVAAEMETWIDAAPVAMLVVDADGRLLVANRLACEMFGRPRDLLVGGHVEELMPAAFRPQHQKHVAGFFAAMVPRVMGAGREVYGIDASGREFPVEIGLSPLVTPAGPRVVAAIIDITERKRRERESNLARLVQEAILPKIPAELPGLEICARSEQADCTGGDFYDLVRFPDGRTGLVISDASGHGFAAALVTAIARSYLRALTHSEPDLGGMLRTANDLLVEDGLDSRFVTLLFVIFDPRAMQLNYAAAGHVGYLLDAAGRMKCTLDNEGLPLGYCAGSEYAVTTVAVEPGDLLVLLTDGIEEAMRPGGTQFGRERVMDLLGRTAGAPVARIVESLFDEVHVFRGPGSAQDDATAVIARVGVAGG